MAKNLTQAECRKSFAELVSAVIVGIDNIDKATPAGPVEEPLWWCDMLDIQRKLIAWRDAYGKV